MSLVEALRSETGLAILGFAMVGTFTALILTRRASVLTALVLTPVAFGLVGGFGAELGRMSIEGVRQIAPTVAMIAFAVLYFSLMLDAGLFEPLVRAILGLTREDPVRVALGTAVLALIVAFSGDGISTGLILIAAFLPLYRRLKMSPAVLGCLIFIAVAVQNLSPWGGPTPRAAAALGSDPAHIYLSLLPAVVAGACATVGVAWLLGRHERRRLSAGRAAFADLEVIEGDAHGFIPDETARRPKRFAVNLILTVSLLLALISGLAPPMLLFPIAAALALLVNYPSLADQRQRLESHADNLVSFILLFFAAGVFTGILNGTGMIEAMAAVAVEALPDGVGRAMGPITALLSMPLTYFMPNDAFFFGALPVIAETSSAFGLTHQQVAAASVLGQPVHVFSPLLPSLYVFASLLGVDVGRFLRSSVPWAVLVSLVMTLTALLTGAIPFLA